jgi:ferrochelatase
MRVQTTTLKIFAGIVWVLVGAGLLIAGMRFIFGLNEPEAERSSSDIALALGLGCLVGALKGYYVLSQTARRNRKRILKLYDPRIWQVFTRGFVLLILLMMAIGRGLRALASAGYLGGYLGVGGIYVGIGLALWVGSLVYFLAPPPPMPTRIDKVPAQRQKQQGLLIVNLGSPSAPTTKAVRAFLRQFLWDPRVVEVSRALWAFVLNVIILPFRAGSSAKLYQAIWTEKGSPLILHGQALQQILSARLKDRFPVALGMRYGTPSIGEALAELKQQGCSSVLLFPLFPQYSNSTSGSVIAEVSRLLLEDRDPMELEVVPPYYDHPLYIEALAVVAEEQGEVDFTVFSFHGIPEAYVKAGDPYLEHCSRCAWLLAERLGLARDEWEMVFQSQFGSDPWLQPYLDEYVPSIAKKYSRLRIIPASFTADCLETMEEINLSLREDFEQAGGQELIVVPALNTHEAWIKAITELV